jgi:AraC-like DNA-binding protein
MQYFTQMRMAQARERLLTTSASIKEIALQVGYADQLHFSRVFRKHFGLSPRAFRRGAPAAHEMVMAPRAIHV